MKTKLSFVAVFLAASLSCLSTGVAAEQRSDRAEPRSARLLERFDLDASDDLNEAELTSLFVEFEERRLSQALGMGESRALQLSEASRAKRDVFFSTPQMTAEFVIANFDEDGDWRLNKGEVSTAFATLRRWHESERTDRGAVRT